MAPQCLAGVAAFQRLRQGDYCAFTCASTALNASTSTNLPSFQLGWALYSGAWNPTLAGAH